MRFFEPAKTAIIERINEAFRVKIDYNSYLKMDEVHRRKFNLYSHFDEQYRAWLVDEQDIRKVLECLFEAGFQISIIGEAEKVKAEIKRKIAQAEAWLKTIKRYPVICFMKPVWIKKGKKEYLFANKGEGKKIWIFSFEETPEEVLKASKKVKVSSSKGKKYTLFIPTKEAISLLQKKYSEKVTALSKRKKFEIVQFLDYQQRLLENPLNTKYTPHTITQP